VLLALAAGAALASPLGALAQPAARIYRIGYLYPGLPDVKRVEAFWAGLREYGYVEGQNAVIELRWAEGKYERLPELAAELVRLRVDVIVSSSSPTTAALMRATSMIPIVATGGDLIAAGLADSLAQPGRNVTGISFFSRQLAQKRLELLKAVVPRVVHVAVLHNSANQLHERILEAMWSTAKPLGITLRPYTIRGSNDFADAFSAMAKDRVDALIVHEDPIFTNNSKLLADLALGKRLPLVGGKVAVEGGGLLGYGVDIYAVVRRSAYFVDRILRGAKPSELPIERPTNFELIVNVKTANVLGLTIADAMLSRADKVIE